MFHGSRQIEDDGHEKWNAYVDLGDDQPHEVDEKLNMRAKEASLSG